MFYLEMVYVPYVNEVLEAVAVPLKYLLSSTKSAPVEMRIIEPVYPSYGSLIRLAGFSGALSILAGAYGAHSFSPDREKDKGIFHTGAHYQLIHSVALLGAPQASRPYLVGCPSILMAHFSQTAGLFLLGMSLFCGSCYYVALTRDARFSKIAPIGGVTLVVAWLSLML
ncbi:hypothetical protein EG68_04623 [Paragonimus skrjabini miyazakii]|uniref:Transmembrane protein n=1 Tax=Paragonimus skrjabini miyazakii TaxID=59628 RepID=A0A8S9YXL2_9TREM|nr:hypothetical protein EG68_04623 [Paragonimus skrjabini miyazakii]